MIFTHKRLRWLAVGFLFVLFIAGCSSTTVQETAVSLINPLEMDEQAAAAAMLTLPKLDAANLNGNPLKVVATTSIMGDVVAQVGGNAIELTTLMGPGLDPHSYEPAARTLTAVAEADIIFVNGWDLEETLVQDLAEISQGVPIVAISANIEPLPFGENDHDSVDELAEGEDRDFHGRADPHVWFNIHHVEQWVENVKHVVSDLDPNNIETYQNNAADYLAELELLKEYAASQLAQIPEENRILVTNHDSLRYFSNAYGFELIGTVIPTASTLAEPSASDLVVLIEKMEVHGLCTIFTETTVSDTLAQTVAGELNGCGQVEVLSLFTGAVGPTGSNADSYIGMFRANIDTIVAGLG